MAALNPEIFTIGEHVLPPYGVMMVLAAVVGFSMGLSHAGRLGFTLRQALEGSIISWILALVSARVLYVVLNPGYFQDYPEYIYLFRFALFSVHGAVGGLALGLFLWSRWRKESFLRCTDAVFPYYALAYVIVRVGCFFAGCCYGKVSDVFWAVPMVEIGPEPRHPVQLYAAAAMLVLFFFSMYLRRFKKYHGFITFFLVGGYGLIRFVTEFFREWHSQPYWMGLTEAQLASIALLVLSSAFMLVMYSGERTRKKRGFSA